MIVRLIYRPSHPGVLAPPRTEPGWGLRGLEAPDFAAEEARRELEPPPPPRPAPSYSGVLRSVALFLVRLGLAMLAMAAWRIAVDLGLPIPFLIPGGIFSHWQVWFAAAVVLLGAAGLVVRRLEFGRGREGRNRGRAQAA